MTTVVIGGGAAGFFAALAAKEAHPQADVILLEKSSQLLSKVKISGGGRCNVTHACFEPKELIKNYPRGSRELLGPFTRFQPLDTINWFEKRGVQLKTESDGRMFPVTDNSGTIVDCLQTCAKQLKIDIRLRVGIEKVEKTTHGFTLTLSSEKTINCTALIIATGSHPSGYKLAALLGHTTQEPVPSLFTFNIPSSPLKDLAGIVAEPVTLSFENGLRQTGSLLITHWGFSGPAALKLSAWAARDLKLKDYHTSIKVDWVPLITHEHLVKTIKELRKKHSLQLLANNPPSKLPKKLWKKLLEPTGIQEKRISEISNDEMTLLCRRIKSDVYKVEGKTTHKEEFVTCGGITLQEVNFKTMESKICPGLFFAGEILDVDAVTGGFNFQNAWTTGWIAGRSASSRSYEEINDTL